MWRKSAQPKLSSQVPHAASPVSSPLSSSVELSPESAPPIPAAAAIAQASAAESGSAAAGPGPSEIAWHLKIDGEISGDSDLYIDGEVRGRIRIAKGRVTIGPRGSVHADIEAREIVIDGHVEGGVSAVESVRLGASGHVQGKMLAPRIRIDEGAFFRGAMATISTIPASAVVVDAHDGDVEPSRPVPVGATDEQGTE